MGAGDEPPFAWGHALLIGVSEYENSSGKVPVAAAEAQGIYNALVDPMVAGYAPEEVTLLTGSTANRVNILDALDSLAQYGDMALIFYCGQGLYGDDGNYHLSTWDTVFSSDRIIAGTGLSESQLAQSLSKIRARKLLLIINSSYAGALSTVLGSMTGADGIVATPLNLNMPQSLRMALLSSGAGRAVMVSSQKTQHSYLLGSEPYSFFGQSLIDGIYGQADGNRGIISLYNLYQYVYQSVTEKVKQKIMGSEQEPLLSIVDGVGEFAVALYNVSTPSLGDKTEVALDKAAHPTPSLGDKTEVALDKAAHPPSRRKRDPLKRKRATGNFDVFLCHNSLDKPMVQQIGNQLIAQGILPWLDQWELRPGMPWQNALEEQIQRIKAAAVFVGKNSFGPWHDLEVASFLRQFVKRNCPVIPVLLPDCADEPTLPIFLDGMMWVDFRVPDPDPVQQLIWGITGIKTLSGGGSR